MENLLRTRRALSLFKVNGINALPLAQGFAFKPFWFESKGMKETMVNCVGLLNRLREVFGSCWQFGDCILSLIINISQTLKG